MRRIVAAPEASLWGVGFGRYGLGFRLTSLGLRIQGL
jgi:hypothetical protein